MRLSITTTLLALCTSAHGLADSSPFLILSTHPFSQEADAQQLQSSSQVLKKAHAILSSCPTDNYLLASQPSSHFTDLEATTTRLHRAISSKKIQGRFSVSEVVGQVEVDRLAEYIKTACAQKSKTPDIHEIKLPPLPSSPERQSRLSDNDYILGENIDKIQSGSSYTIIYLSSPTEPTYEALFAEPLHAELKREAQAIPLRRADSDTDFNKLPLFMKYQFFSPGIFMGLIAVIVMSAIVTVGLRALSSLEVSYGAFDKEMGPAAQKKQM